MTLRDEFVQSGNWLFRWRSYLPLLLVALLVPGLRHSALIDDHSARRELWEAFCLAVSLLGLAIRTCTVGHVPSGTSGRNARQQVAARLNTDGMYSLVRHPLYLGNFCIWLGVSLFVHVWWVTLIAVLVFWLYYERIMFAEEAFLERQFGSQYLAWAGQTPAFLPRLSAWKRPGLPFSLRMVLRRECSTILGVAAMFAALDAASTFCVAGKVELAPLWASLLAFAGALYLVLRFLKRRTTVLVVAGR